MPAMLALLCAAVLQPDHVATRPADRLGEGWWKERHERCVAQTKAGGIDLVFLGDSITQGWEGAGKPTWDRLFAPRRAANFGFSGDRTEHVLWRLANGEIVGLDPRLVVIMIGTNNIGHGSSTPGQTADGVRAIVTKLLTELPKTKILLLGIFPRSERPDDPLRVKAAEATAAFKDLADGKRVFFQDIGHAFVYRDGSLRKFLMPDLLHLSPDGYELWGKAIAPTVDRLIGP